MFPKIGVPQNGWWKSWKTLLKWMIWGYHYFWKHPDRFTQRLFLSHLKIIWDQLGWDLTTNRDRFIQWFEVGWQATKINLGAPRIISRMLGKLFVGRCFFFDTFAHKITWKSPTFGTLFLKTSTKMGHFNTPAVIQVQFLFSLDPLILWLRMICGYFWFTCSKEKSTSLRI